MRCLAGLLAIICLVMGFCLSSSGLLLSQTPQSKDKDAKDKEKEKDRWKIEDLVKSAKESAGRKNGVLLEAKVEVTKDAKGDVLLLHWSIDYTGPRFPLHILKPSLESAWHNQTYLKIYPVDEQGLTYLFAIPPPDASPKLHTFSKEDFVTVKKGEVAKGTIKVPWTAVIAQKVKTGKGRVPPVKLYVQLVHAPKERGEQFNLDAWISGPSGGFQTSLSQVQICRSDKD
jgi:hypothetical protein